MLKKVLVILLASLIATVVVVVGALTTKQKESTIRSFSEQQTTLVQFAVDNVELGLSGGRMDAVKKTLQRLQSYSIFKGSIVYDDEMTPLLVLPETFKVPPDVEEEVRNKNKARRELVSYEGGPLKDEDGEVIGHLLIAFTFAPVEAEIGQAALNAYKAGLFTLIPVIGFSVLLIRKMIRPLKKVVKVLEGVADGDLTQRLDIMSRDETGRISVALNKAIEQMRLALEKIKVSGEREKEQAEMLQAKVDNILHVVDGATRGDLTQEIQVNGRDTIGLLGEGLASFLSNLKDSIYTIGVQSQTLAGSSETLTEVSRSMGVNAKQSSEQATVASNTSEQINENVQHVTASVEEMRISIKEIAENSSKASSVATSAAAMAEETNTIISKLDRNNNEIKHVIKVITSLADQTKLLALNATIEAARAGKAGKGFAVVANEVKQLSQGTAKAAEEIRTKIGTIQEDTEKAVQVIGKISSVIIEVNNLQTMIAAAVEEQSCVVNGIADNLSTAAEGTSQISQSISQVANAASDVARGASDTETAAAELSDMATTLWALVQQYQISALERTTSDASLDEETSDVALF